MTRIVIVGAGGHAHVVADIILAHRRTRNEWTLVGLVDDDPSLAGRFILAYPILGSTDALDVIPHDAVVIAVGDNEIRRRLFNRFRRQGTSFVTAIHPSATVADDVSIGAGTVVCAGVVVNSGSLVGENAILNSGCTVDHHNEIGSHVHIAPGVNTGGEVAVGEGALIGIGATVMPRRRVGPWATVGAGAVVTRNVTARTTVVGVPARLHV